MTAAAQDIFRLLQLQSCALIAVSRRGFQFHPGPAARTGPRHVSLCQCMASTAPGGLSHNLTELIPLLLIPPFMCTTCSLPSSSFPRSFVPLAHSPPPPFPVHVYHLLAPLLLLPPFMCTTCSHPSSFPRSRVPLARTPPPHSPVHVYHLLAPPRK